MIKIEVQLVLTDHTGKESVPVSLKSSNYSPDALERLVNDSLSKALKKLKFRSLESFKPFEPEISIRVSGLASGGLRPALHLSSVTLSRIAASGASFDFDPYF